MSDSQQPQKITDAEVGIHGRTVRIRYFLGGFITGVGSVVITAFRFAGFNPLLITLLFLAMLVLLIGIMGVRRASVVAFLEGIRRSSKDDDDAPYMRAKPYAMWLKVRLQMGVGLVALVALLFRLLNNDLLSSEDIFALVSCALAIAAVIELAHTLFTPGPDEALDPLALGLSAALLLQLAKLDKFDYQQAIAALLYVLALGALFAIRRRWSEVERRRRAAVEHGAAKAGAALGARRRDNSQ
jgi:hypothetical protein